MAEQHLDDPQVCAALQEMRCKTVAQSMDSDVLVELGGDACIPAGEVQAGVAHVGLTIAPCVREVVA